ncbi:MAG TPA: 2-oxoglutarate synthase, partial [Candidatus Portnoybacteria bacterium]|nr:2-oxoglutarate synthase [Candidatus Portnoybacteria bacterium]
DNITVIVINNATYGMTGGQEAPTTLPGQITATTPYGADKQYIKGPEMITSVNQSAYLARGTVANFEQLKTFIEKALKHQLANRGFSLVEILSRCPIGWKTNTRETWRFLEEMTKYFKIGEIQK